MKSREGSGGFQNWEDLRNHAIERFGETPHPATEQEIIDAYELHPDAVEKAIDAVAHDVKNGTVRSGWGALRYRAAQIRTPIANPTRNSSLEREKRIGRAEQWLRNAGLHFDSLDEVLLELFGDNGNLRDYAQVDLTTERPYTLTSPRGDAQLVDRITRLWNDLRPLGVQAETEAQERADKWRREQTLREQALAAAHTEIQQQAERQAALIGAGDPDDDLPV